MKQKERTADPQAGPAEKKKTDAGWQTKKRDPQPGPSFKQCLSSLQKPQKSETKTSKIKPRESGSNTLNL